MARRNEISLDRERIVAAAFGLVAESGLDALSMRTLAARLSVQAPALYWHISDKAELLGAMAGSIYAEARAAVADTSDWQAWLLAFGRSFRAALLSRRDAARLCSVARPLSTDPASVAKRIAEPLVRRGLGEHDALAFQASVISFTLGWSIYRESSPMRDFLAGMMDFDESYETGLQALVRGFGPGSATC